MGDLGFWALAHEDPDHLALVAPDGVEYSAGDLLGRANQVVHALRGIGLQPGDVVATLLPNGVEMFELYLAVLQAGWYLVPINHHLIGPEVAYILDDSGAQAFVAHERFEEVARAAADEAGLPTGARLAVGNIDGFASYDSLREAETVDDPADRTIGDTMNYTSGTTGNPKGVFRPLSGLSPEEAALGLSGILFLFGIQPQDDNVHIVGSPLYHTAVLRFSGASVHLGHTVVLMDKWIPEEMLQLIAKNRVTTSHMVPTQFHRLLALPEETRAKYDMSSLRHMIHAAAPCPIDVKYKMIDWWGNAIDEYYAASEGGGTLVTAEEWLDKPGTVGRPWPISEIAIFDDEGNRVEEANVIGTVYMSMQTSDFSYHKDEKKTKSNRIGKYFTVGDVGLIDEDGYLFLRDRKIDMIISGGANIYPAEIENVLLGFPKVGDVAVFGIPHEDWGEEIKAVVEPAEGVDASPELAEEILEYCSSRLAKFKTPKSIDFTNAIPRDPNGKLYKRKLRDPYWEGREKI
ncbi:MAG TPA: acyl-CoA synthetase [Acidimicrobiales bacterium]|jgi:long-chain acyl-CoA synthetase|nr:acyl-CoA synthetase [Acidimicrobiales bacterium]